MDKGYTYGNNNGLNYEQLDKEPKSDENLTFNNKVIENVDDLDSDHLKEILTAKVLLPVKKIEEMNSTDRPNNEETQSMFVSPIQQGKPISIENALIYGEKDRFYYIIDPNKKIDPEDDGQLHKCEVVGLHVINMQYDNIDCSMIIFRNWTLSFRFQFATTQSQMQEMVTATVSHEMRTPINSMMMHLNNLEFQLKQDDQLVQSPQIIEVQKMTRIIRNSAQFLLYLVNDMLDVYMLKNGKFLKIQDEVKIEELMAKIYEMFCI